MWVSKVIGIPNSFFDPGIKKKDRKKGLEHPLILKPPFKGFFFNNKQPFEWRFHKWGCLKIGMLETYSFWLKTNIFEHRYFETFPNNGVPNPSFDTGIPLKCVRQVQSSLAC
jgi:hypothetical protein